jgi:hypothetical protein
MHEQVMDELRAPALGDKSREPLFLATGEPTDEQQSPLIDDDAYVAPVVLPARAEHTIDNGYQSRVC